MNSNNYQLFNPKNEKKSNELGENIRDNMKNIAGNSNSPKSFLGHEDKEKSSLSSGKKIASQFTLMKRKSYASNANPSKFSIQSRISKLLVIEVFFI